MLRLLVATVLVVTGTLLLVARAPAHFDASGRYTHRACPPGSSTRADPINVVVHRWGTWGRAVSQIESHVGWTAASGSQQLFADHGGCLVQHAQRASGEGSRFHARIRGQHWEEALGWTAAVAVHHEDLVLFPFPCGHAVDANGPGGSGFDQGRAELEARFATAGHAASRSWWGNTQSLKQCDGDYAASDGWVSFVAVHESSH